MDDVTAVAFTAACMLHDLAGTFSTLPSLMGSACEGFPERNLIPCKNIHSMAVVQEQLITQPLEVCPPPVWQYSGHM